MGPGAPWTIPSLRGPPGTRVRDRRTNLIAIGYVRPTARPGITVATKRSTSTLHPARCTLRFAQRVEGAWFPTSDDQAGSAAAG